jgi:hypothetical protein
MKPASPFFDNDRSLDYDRLIRCSLPGYEALHANVLNGRPAQEVEADFKKSSEVVSIISNTAYERLLKKCGFTSPRMFFKVFMFCGWISFKG